MRVYVNNEIKNLPWRISLKELVENLGLGPQRVAVELNGLVVPRAEWASTLIADDDRVEIVYFVGGGEVSTDYASDRSVGSTVLSCKQA